MQPIGRRRVTTRVRSFEAGSWLDPAPRPAAPAPRGRAAVAGAAASGLAALLCVAWWAAAPEVLVASARREGGRVLVCKHLVGARVVERQQLLAAHEADRRACPLVRFAASRGA